MLRASCLAKASFQGKVTGFSSSLRMGWKGHSRFLCTTLEQPIPGSKHKLHFFTMPDLMDAKEGKVKKWLKKEGEAFGEDEPICELSCSGISVELDPETAGIMIDRLAIEGVTVEVNKPIASYVLNKDAYMSYIESKHVAAEEAERMAEAKQVSSEKSKKPDNMVLMREIKHLMQAGHIQEGSDYAKTLQSLARRGDQELMDVFTASFDGVAFDKDSFDVSFFVDNTKELVKEKAGK